MHYASRTLISVLFSSKKFLFLARLLDTKVMQVLTIASVLHKNLSKSS